MNCHEIRELIARDASENEREIEAHTEACEDCRAYRDDMAAIGATLNRMKQVEPPDGSLTRVHAHLYEYAERRRRRVGALRLGGVAALTLLVIAGVWTSRPMPETSTNSQIAKQTIDAPAQPADDAPPMIVKLYTDDPDIVIYWFGD